MKSYFVSITELLFKYSSYSFRILPTLDLAFIGNYKYLKAGRILDYFNFFTNIFPVAKLSLAISISFSHSRALTNNIPYLSC